jgi:HSP20 family protein
MVSEAFDVGCSLPNATAQLCPTRERIMRTGFRRPVLSRSTRRSHPLVELNHLWRELDRWAVAPLARTPRARLSARATIQHDAESDAWTMSAPLPGRRADQVDITIEDGVLLVSSAAVASADEGFSTVHTERSTRPVRLRWTLPDDADLDSIQATLTDGWLRVELSRQARPQPRTIPVVAG